VVDEDDVLDYNLGYTYFKLKDYPAKITALDYENKALQKKTARDLMIPT
jgi:hypothetical protein